MNLTKLFNIKYLKENLRKSKGILFLICILVPVFTTLIISFNFSIPDKKIVASQYDIAIINILGMFFVPIIISNVLFGYVFKKNSVDLINSMPLKRETIFVTNTIGGIILITIIQALTAILLLLCSIFFKAVYIFPAMIWDIFVLMWLTYVFIFVASNIAMSVSGTFLTQCAVTLLILFLVPFCIVSFNRFYNSNQKVVIYDNNGIVAQFSSNSNYKVFTTPASIIYNGLTNNLLYIPESLIRTAVLSVVYIAIGLKLFKKRKMENAEESFESAKVHLFIKALTMVPMIALGHYVVKYSGIGTIVYALIIFYYFAYDFIVKKKIALKYSIPALIVIIFCLEGICSFSDYAYDKFDFSRVKINKNDIKMIGIDFQNIYGYYNYSRTERFTNNRELIDTILEIEKEKNNGNSDGIENHLISVKLKDRRGKKYSFYISMSDNSLNKIVEKLNDENINEIKKDYTRNGKIEFNGIAISDEKFEKELDNDLKNLVENMNKKELAKFEENTGYICLVKQTYANHQLVSRLFSIEASKEMQKTIADYENNKTINLIKNISDTEKDNWSYGVFIENGLKNFESESIDVNSGNYYISYYQSDVIKFIEKDKDSKFDNNKDYYVIRCYYYSGMNSYDLYYFTNNIEEVNRIVKNDVDKMDEENKEYYVKQVFDTDEEVVENVESNEV